MIHENKNIRFEIKPICSDYSRGMAAAGRIRGFTGPDCFPLTGGSNDKYGQPAAQPCVAVPSERCFHNDPASFIGSCKANIMHLSPTPPGSQLPAECSLYTPLACRKPLYSATPSAAQYTYDNAQYMTMPSISCCGLWPSSRREDGSEQPTKNTDSKRQSPSPTRPAAGMLILVRTLL